jgi:hypothetical protein
MKRTVWQLKRGIFLWCVAGIIVAEGMGVFYSFYIVKMIEYIRNPKLDFS